LGRLAIPFSCALLTAHPISSLMSGVAFAL